MRSSEAQPLPTVHYFTQLLLTRACKHTSQPLASLFHQPLSVMLLPWLTAKCSCHKMALASYPSHPFHVQCRKNVSLDFTPGLLIAALLLNLFSDMLLAFYRHNTYFLESLHDSSVSH